MGQRASDPAPTETDPLPCDSHANRTDLDWDAIDAKLAALPEDLRDVAEHLQERINHRSPFARLTTDDRKTILQLIADHTGPEVVRIVAEPPPIGFNIKTSKQALSRFKRDHMRYEINQVREAQRLAAEEAHKAFEKAFSECISSNEAFCAATERNIKRRLFEATRNPSADFQEIRWLVSSLAMLRKQLMNAQPKGARGCPPDLLSIANPE